ncbi:eukaryotic translation initiation factor 3, subunit 3 gamma, isoform CRA_a [Rattus norvegicus]|uniref:Eukaryotic translation initiation factor 3, subunit 3 gamma, isoform CRA_a n=1 Tax=Rattus norvegicus TaxID=10116 RepID=A6HRE1_RAT|nr:eukaryotic translation initiation factor 3, subunit 3 gamma, isoform CRA_a [Rattus norvegicus]
MASRKEGTGSTATSSSSTGGAVGKGKGKGGSGDSAVKQVQIDGLVVLKIIKHYQEEGQGTEVVQGVLLGLVVEDRLEITNCFPFPQHTEDDADFDEVQYQMEMMRSLRHVLMWELEKKSAVADKHELLSLASSNHLGKNLQLLMDRVDEMSQDIIKYNTYMRNSISAASPAGEYAAAESRRAPAP